MSQADGSIEFVSDSMAMVKVDVAGPDADGAEPLQPASTTGMAHASATRQVVVLIGTPAK
ncbi:hypothetical protein Acsp01_69550 [Actinoplanes sp. NBRC 101535]|nr:hypothetical protein Acsp01_69550 [Actinoplanes sp. NBRC 101535]